MGWGWSYRSHVCHKGSLSLLVSPSSNLFTSRTRFDMSVRNDLSHTWLVLSTVRPKTYQTNEGNICLEAEGETKSWLVSSTLEAADRSFEGLKPRPKVNRRRCLLCSGEGERKKNGNYKTCGWRRCRRSVKAGIGAQ